MTRSTLLLIMFISFYVGRPVKSEEPSTVPPDASKKEQQSNLPDEEPVFRQVPKGHSNKSLYLLTISGGLVTGTHTNTFYNSSSGVVLGSGSSDGGRSIYLSGDTSFGSDGPLAVGLTAQYNKYSYQGVGNSDSHFCLLVHPKAVFGTQAVSFWIGPLAGIMLTTIGDTSSTANGTTIAASSDKATSFAYGSKAGVDVWLNNRLFVGVEATYLSTSFSIDGSLRSSTTTITGTADVNRSWWQLGARVGFAM